MNSPPPTTEKIPKKTCQKFRFFFSVEKESGSFSDEFEAPYRIKAKEKTIRDISSIFICSNLKCAVNFLSTDYFSRLGTQQIP